MLASAMEMQKKVAVLGFGRVGLPLGLVLAKKDFYVIGVDVDAQHIAKVQSKVMPFKEEGAQELLEKHYGKNLRVIHNSLLGSIMKELDYIIITLGTPLSDTYGPDFSQLDSVIDDLALSLQNGQTIILRSTVSPGTTELVARKFEKKGYRIGKDIFLAFCPERIAEGKSIQELEEIPQIIGAITKNCDKKARAMFSKFSPILKSTDPRSAELAKLYSNMYRYIDFAIGNEFMMIAEDHDRDIYKILDLVNGDYKRGGLKAPGLTAGPCLVKDGFFLIDKGPYLELVTAAWRINENIPGFLLERIKQNMDLSDKKVVILGLTFKKNTDDTRYSLSYKFKRHFLSEGADVVTHDPHVKPGSIKKVLKNADVIVLAVNHDEYKTIQETIYLEASKECIVCDIWNMFGAGKIIYRTAEYSGSKIHSPNGHPLIKSRKKADNPSPAAL